MSTLYVMVGIMGSGKSYKANLLNEKLGLLKSVIVSSDEVRKQLFNDVTFQGGNSAVFLEMENQTKSYLKSGIDVIYDATNLSRKKRVALIKKIRADRNIVYYMATSFKTCVVNDNKRERRVGYDVVARAYKQLQVPIITEGWDEVSYTYRFEDIETSDSYKKYGLLTLSAIMDLKDITCELFESELGIQIDDFKLIEGLSQDSKYHSFSVSRHTYFVFKYIQDNYWNIEKTRRENLLLAAMFHDIGKYFCKSFVNHKGESTRYSNFIGHENVSAQIADLELQKLGMNADRIREIVTLIQFHMDLNHEGDKIMMKLERFLIPSQIEDLLILHEADLSAK